MKYLSPIAFVFIVWAAMSIFTLAALNADWRAEITCQYRSSQQGHKSQRDFRTNMAFAVIPVFWVLSPLITGFYYQGFSLNSGPCSEQEAASRL